MRRAAAHLNVALLILHKLYFINQRVMKKLIILFLAVGLFSCGSTTEYKADTIATKDLNEAVVEATCGQCNWEMGNEGCEPAVKIDGKRYWVEGIDMMDLGDPHDEGGMCLMVRKAKVSGRLENGIFTASAFELLPL